MLKLRKSAKYFIMSINKNLLTEIINYRSSEIEELISHIQDNNRLWWYEERRQGKSTLLNQIKIQHPQWKFIYLDLFPILNISDFITKYATTQAQELFKNLNTVPDVVRECKKYFKSFHPDVKFEQNLITLSLKLEDGVDNSSVLKEVLNAPQKYADANKKETICVVFDDFPQINEISLDLINEFSQVLEAQDLPYIFLSSSKAKIESIFADSKSSLYNMAQRFVMKPLSESEWRLLIIQAFRDKGSMVPQKVINLIIEWSQGQAHYIFTFCKYIENLLNQNVDLASNPEQFLNDIIAQEESFFKELFDTLTANQKKALLILARTKGENIYKAQITEEYAINKSSLERCVQSLEQNNIVVKTQRGILQFKNPILRAWLIKKF